MKEPILSLCLPTNGIIEWVFPVLDSIYSQSVENDLFEVVVTNNGTDDKFHQMMIDYAAKHKNLKYRKTDVFMFHNQLESLRLANGKFLKFINHRACMVNGSLQEMLRIIQDNILEKPVMYFSNGELKKDYLLNSFNEFVAKLGRFASWTTGVGIWKSDYDNLPLDTKVDKISPHSCILFANRDKKTYKIYDYLFSTDVVNSHKNKGTYDLFKAFGIEELSITQNLYIDGDITINTFKSVKKDYRKLLVDFYWQFCIMKRPCSYDLKGFNDAMGIYFDKSDIIFRAYVSGFYRLIKKILGRK